MKALAPSVLRTLIMRGHAKSPMTEDQLELFKASCRLRVLEQMQALVSGETLYTEGGRVPYLAHVTNREGLGTLN